jgi:hypothetical protein
MKVQVITALAVLGLSASAVQAQVNVIGGQQLIAGWDFNQYVGAGLNAITVDPDTTDAIFATTFDANYSSLLVPGGFTTNGVTSGTPANPFGTVYYNGQFGSTAVQTGRGLDEIAPFTGSLLSNINTGGPFGRNTGLTSNGYEFAEELSLYNTVSGSRAVFEADLTSINYTGANWTLSFAGKVAATGTTTVGVEFSTDGVNFNNLGVANLTNLDTPYSFAVAGNTSSTAYFRLTMNGLGVDATTIDNLGITASDLQVIPEPSTYAAILGALTIGFVALRRRFQAKLA